MITLDKVKENIMNIKSCLVIDLYDEVVKAFKDYSFEGSREIMLGQTRTKAEDDSTIVRYISFVDRKNTPFIHIKVKKENYSYNILEVI